VGEVSSTGQDPGLGRRWRRVRGAVEEETRDLQLLLWFVLLVCRVLPPYVGCRVRAHLLRAAGASIGSGTLVFGRLDLTGPRPAARSLEIGEFCFVNDGCHFETAGSITIGDHVSIGHDVLVLTTTHELGPGETRAGRLVRLRVRIGDGAWIGSRAVILPGVEVGAGAVVAAGAVVTKTVPPNALVGGVPAVVIRELD
jgi:maltose O-acetyltransferase